MPEIDLSGFSSETLASAAEAFRFEPALVSSVSLEALRRDRSLHKLAGPAPSELSRLSTAHRAAVALHLAGSPAAEIADRLQRPISWVALTLRDPLARRIIDAVLALHDMEIAALMPLATAAVRQQLINGSGQQRLRAADIVYKANHRYIEEKEQGRTTAEDVIQQILAFASKALEAAAGRSDSTLPMATHSPPLLEGVPNALSEDEE